MSSDTRRPSHDELMQAVDHLGRAREIEMAVGNTDRGMEINDIALAVFRAAIRVDKPKAEGPA